MKEGGRRVEKERGNALRVENCFTSIFFSKPLIMFRDVGGRQPHAFVKTKTKKKKKERKFKVYAADIRFN